MQNKYKTGKIRNDNRAKIIATAEIEFAEFGYKDSLPQYVVNQLRITDPRVLRESGKKFHPILQYTGKFSD